ncbi:MAG: YfhO family protein [Clostridia bacterium]|nr:YfhO family protein [Clostridia bacterium]
MEIYPFGKYSILKSDLYNQYINFFCYLREVILHGKSIAISWNLGLANNFYTTFAYYLMSPLNILVVFFNTSNMDIFVEILIAIKIILIANFMMFFLEKSYNYKSNETIIFGLIYAFSSYVICYSFHIMWLDCVYMLPIILLFVDKFLENGKILPIVLSLSYAILTNYYIGYIVAFFAGIYFLPRYFITQKKSVLVDFGKVLFKFLLAIGISFGIGMIVILPSIMQLKGTMSTDISLIEIDEEKIRMFTNVVFNNYIYSFTQKSCLVFSSTFIILLLPMYYLNKKINVHEKLAFSAIIVFLLLPIISPFLNKLWHAFTVPNCFNYRYSFTLIFTLILMGAREFQHKEYCKKWHFAVSGLCFTFVTILEIIFLKKGYLVLDRFSVSIKSIVLSCFVYLLMLCITYMYFNKKNLRKTWALLLLVVIIFDLLVGAKSGQNNDDKYFERRYVVQYDSFMKHFIPKIKNPEIERIVFEPDEYGSNMSLKFGYSNIGFFTSARNTKNLESMYRLGYNVQMDDKLWVTSFSGTFLNYYIAGVKYYITRRQLEDNEIYGFEFIEKYDNFYVYKNKNNLNIGYYLADNNKQNDNPFEMQNELIRGFLKNNGNYNDYSNNEGKSQKEDIISKENFFQSIESSSVLECEKNVIDYETKNNNLDSLEGEKANSSSMTLDEKKIKYKVKAKKDCNIYLFSKEHLQLYIDGKPQFKDYSNIWSFENGIKQIKHLKQNEEFEFEINTKQNMDLIYVSDNEKIQQVLDNKDKNYFDNVIIKKNGLTGTAHFKDDGYLTFGIAYDKCWDIFVDGKKAEKEAIAGCLLGVKLEKGEHNVEIRASIF